MQAGMTKTLKTVAFTGMMLLLACGGGRDREGMAIEPDPPVVRVGETLSLAAHPRIEGAGAVDWEVQEMYGGGLLQSQGLRITYVAPEAAGTYHLILRAQGRPKQVVEVRVVADASVEPASVRLAPGGSCQFQVHMKGLVRDTAVWAVEEAEGGEISPEGRYTAPHRPGLFHVTATSTLDPSSTARSTVTVSDS